MDTLKVPLSVFLDFVTKAGQPRISVVRSAKKFVDDPAPFPARSYYHSLECRVIRAFKGGADRGQIRMVPYECDPRRRDNYSECVEGLLKWMGRKQFRWEGSRTVSWEAPGVTIGVRPQLGFSLNGESWRVRLYYKSDPLRALALAPMLHLMRELHPSHHVGVLDVRRGKLLMPGRSVPGMSALLESEAIAFRNVWYSL
jgi:hypothetical protein